MLWIFNLNPFVCFSRKSCWRVWNMLSLILYEWSWQMQEFGVNYVSILSSVRRKELWIWVRTHIRCVTCVCARSGSRCIHTGRRRQRLTEGMSEAWCWRAVIVTTTNHILHWCCMNGIWYLHESNWLADASVGAWKVASSPRFRHALRQALTWVQSENLGACHPHF